MGVRVFVDGHAGTTGLRIRQWLAGRRDIDLLTLSGAERKDPAARRRALEAADLAVLCLPDEAAREAAAWAERAETRIIDASTAHRTDERFVYGLPELAPGQREAIRGASRVSNPGCYPTGFLLLVRPLVDAGILAPDAPLAIHALSGYSGGGHRLIRRWEDPALALASLPFEAPYALERVHKHVPEMMHHAGLTAEPLFVPAVGPFRCGMRVQVPVPAGLLAPGAAARAPEVLRDRYAGEPFVRVREGPPGGELPERALDPRGCNDTNRIELRAVVHPSGHLLLVAILDNLGKGASGAAIQSLNLMLGLPETAGLPV